MLGGSGRSLAVDWKFVLGGSRRSLAVYWKRPIVIFANRPIVLSLQLGLLRKARVWDSARRQGQLWLAVLLSISRAEDMAVASQIHWL